LYSPISEPVVFAGAFPDIYIACVLACMRASTSVLPPLDHPLFASGHRQGAPTPTRGRSLLSCELLSPELLSNAGAVAPPPPLHTISVIWF